MKICCFSFISSWFGVICQTKGAANKLTHWIPFFVFLFPALLWNSCKRLVPSYLCFYHRSCTLWQIVNKLSLCGSMGEWHEKDPENYYTASVGSFFPINYGLRSWMALRPSCRILWSQTTVTVCFQCTHKSPTVIRDFSFLDWKRPACYIFRH